MTDYFSLLNEPRRPALDAARLHEKFLTLAAEVHPDRIHNAPHAEKAAASRHYAELNAAHNCLAEPKSRLLHLVELERGEKPGEIQAIPPALADLFAGIAAICRETDAFLSEKEKVSSPLLKIHWFERAQEWVKRLQAWQSRLGELRAQLDERLNRLDQDWMRSDAAQRPAILPKLEELYRFYSYFNRWQGQLQERAVRLSF